ncbi:hypothetical protein [Phycobacter azelaicus]|uniref:hypothetical protein n=1 Tax=Phycobacter azelaicus TaxID=2668075 RepID=UPI0018689B4A|nr:hypothetical protein [Phycobacter azelaicus]MBE1296643.1 hypothetical protein [Paracoccaceae bacterium]
MKTLKPFVSFAVLLVFSMLAATGQHASASDDSHRKVRFGSWGVPPEAYEALKRLDTQNEIDFGFSSLNGSDYDFFVAVLDGMENVEDFPHFRKLRLSERGPYPSHEPLVEIHYHLDGNDDFVLILMDAQYFSEKHVECIGTVMFELMTGERLVRRKGSEIVGFRNCNAL